MTGWKIVSVDMSIQFDRNKYGALLMETIPQVIENETELLRAEDIVTRLLRKGENLSPEEDKLLDLVSDLIESYEDEHYPIPLLQPHERLKYMMEERGVRQTDLLSVFGSSGIASEVVNGKRSISKAHAKKLAEFFHVSVDLFI